MRACGRRSLKDICRKIATLTRKPCAERRRAAGASVAAVSARIFGAPTVTRLARAVRHVAYGDALFLCCSRRALTSPRLSRQAFSCAFVRRDQGDAGVAV